MKFRSGAMKLCVVALAIAGLCTAGTANAIEVNGIVFDIDDSTSGLTAGGDVTGDFLGFGPFTVSLTPQFSGSLSPDLDGTLEAAIDFSGAVPQTIGFNGGTATPGDVGNVTPGQFTPADPNDPNSEDTFAGPEAGQYGFRLSTFVDSVLRGTALTANSTSPETITAGSFPGTNLSLEYLSQGFLDIFGPAIDAFVHEVPTELIVQFEIDPNAINPDPNNPGPYPGNLVWREITGISDPNTPQAQPIYGNLAVAFSDGALDLSAPDPADAVVLFDPNNPGTALNQKIFHSGGAATLTASAPGGPGGDDVNLTLNIPFDGSANFFLGDFLVEFFFSGNIDAVALGVDTLPLSAGDVNDDGAVNGLDANLVSANFLSSVPPGTLGDANSDGVVNGLDANIISANFLASSPAVGATAIPEPSTMALLGLCLASLGFIRRRRA